MRVATGFSVIAALSVSTVSAVATNSSATKLPLLSDGILDFGVAQEAYDKARSFVDSLSNEQKASIIVGGGFDDGTVSWTPLVSKNGVSGINMAFFVSGFPMMNAATMTWNRDLVEAQFKATGEEFYDSGYNLVYGPVASPLGRDPYGGRLPEGFSPDPYLSGILMGKQISGFNSAGVVTEGRHFLLNEQETNRMGGGYSANADEKTLQEVYLWPFADAVKSGMMAVMCAMNKVNGLLSCENSELLNQYLKTDLGFPGLVSPDVGSQVTSYDSANAGLDLGSSQLWSQQIIIDGIANGNLSQERLDDMAVRNVVGYYYAGLDDGKLPPTANDDEWRDVRKNHSAIIKKVANEAIVLLKNDQSANRGLPLNAPRTISLFGSHAGPSMAGPNQQFSVAGTPGDTYPGHLATGGGAGQASFTYLITPFEPLALRAANDGSMIWWIMNNTYDAGDFSGIPGGGNGGFPGGGGNGSFPGFPGGGGGGGGGGNGSFPGFPGGGDGGGNGSFPGGGGGGGGFPGFGGGTGATPSFETYSLNSEVCIVFINSMSGEGADRHELRNAEQDLMVSTVADNCNNTVVVGNFAGPRLLDSWIEHPNISAVLYSGFLGQTSGQAIADVLHGDVNPSGKLTHTIAKNESDYPFQTCLTTECDFEEGVFIDYRYFDSNNISVRYPFGHGLSYTTFTYGDVAATVTNQSALETKYPTGPLTLGGFSDLFDEVITAEVTIENSGGVDGAEVAQLYLTFPEEAEEPTRILRGFEKVNILAGGQATVEFSLRRRDISYWDATVRQWAIAKGEYVLAVGSSLHDIRSTTTLTI